MSSLMFNCWASKLTLTQWIYVKVTIFNTNACSQWKTGLWNLGMERSNMSRFLFLSCSWWRVSTAESVRSELIKPRQSVSATQNCSFSVSICESTKMPPTLLFLLCLSESMCSVRVCMHTYVHIGVPDSLCACQWVIIMSLWRHTSCIPEVICCCQAWTLRGNALPLTHKVYC